MTEFVQRELDRCERAYQGGNQAALHEALICCEKHTIPLPAWLNDALLKLVIEHLQGGKTYKKKWLARYNTDMIDMERADNVRDCIEHGIPKNKAYYAASLRLENSYAAGDEDAIRKSCTRFEERSKTEPSRYTLIETVRLPTTDTRLTPERDKIWKHILSLRESD